MKRIIPLFLLTALFPAFTPQLCFAEGDDNLPIYIEQTGICGDTPIIRSPDLIPIEAVYYPAISTIIVNFLNNLGSVLVEIENLTTGSYSQTNINASQGVHPFVISGDDGVYEITFTLSDGHVYTGSFEIE